MVMPQYDISFNSITKPHTDILSQSLKVEKYAASLYHAYKGNGPKEYYDSEMFGKMTYHTNTINNVLVSMNERLKHGNGNASLHLETGFGGGKTHTMIAAMHEARKNNYNVVVFDGSKFNVNTTIWNEIETQLDSNSRKIMSGETSPGGIILNKILKKYQPLLIIIDEIMPYVVKAAGKKVGETTLADQTVTFMQELFTEASLLDNVFILASFPSNAEQYGTDGKSLDKMSRILHRLKMSSGRQHGKLIPNTNNDIPAIIRKRLFMNSDTIMNECGKTCDTHAEHLASNDLLENGTTKEQYAELFRKTYPFSPEVFYCLYNEWGTIDSFQRTRGMLRILAIILRHYLNSDKPFITLADFDLSDPHIKGEILQYVPDMASVIDTDIGKNGSNAANVSKTAIRIATTIFMMSFNGNGSSEKNIKSNVWMDDIADVSDTLNLLYGKLYHIVEKNGRSMFTSKSNINKIRNDTHVGMDDILMHEMNMMKESMRGNEDVFENIYYADNEKPDSRPGLKLVILSDCDIKSLNEIFTGKQYSYKNGIVILCACSDDAAGLRSAIAVKIKTELMLKKIIEKYEKNIIEKEHTAAEKESREFLKRAYCKIFVNGINGFPENVPYRHDKNKNIVESVLDSLVCEKKVYLKLSGKNIREKWPDGDARILYNKMMTIPGAIRPASFDILNDALSEYDKSSKTDKTAPVSRNISKDENFKETVTGMISGNKSKELGKLVTDADGFSDVKITIEISGSADRTIVDKWLDDAEQVDLR